MTKFKKILVVCIGAYVLAAGTLAQAQNVPQDQGQPLKRHPGQQIQEIFNQLNLTDVQKKQLESNKQAHRAKMEASRRSMKAVKDAMQVELMKPQLDMARINEIHQRTKALQAQMEDDKLNSILAVREILTPEQFLKFVALMHKHKPATAP